MRKWIRLAIPLAAIALAGCGEPREKTPEEVAQDNAHRQCGAFVRNNLRDPGSLDWDRANVRYHHSDEGVLVVRPFRAANAFGGTVGQEAHCFYGYEQQRLIDVDIF